MKAILILILAGLIGGLGGFAFSLITPPLVAIPLALAWGLFVGHIAGKQMVRTVFYG